MRAKYTFFTFKEERWSPHEPILYSITYLALQKDLFFAKNVLKYILKHATKKCKNDEK